MSLKVHPTAIIDPTVKLGKNVQIEAYVFIGPNSEIGDECIIKNHASVLYNTRIGKSCKIYSYAAVGGDPQDLKYKDEETWLEIGDNVIIREFVTLNRGTTASGRSQIGDHSVFMAYAHVAHDCFIGKNVILANAVQLGGHVTVEDYAIIGGGTVVHQFTRIGAHAMVGGGFRVIMDIMPYAMAGNEPLGIHGINKRGLERRGFTAETLKEINKAYKIFFRQNLTQKQAVKEIRNQCKDLPEISAMIDFIGQSERGLTR